MIVTENEVKSQFKHFNNKAETLMHVLMSENENFKCQDLESKVDSNLVNRVYQVFSQTEVYVLV